MLSITKSIISTVLIVSTSILGSLAYSATEEKSTCTKPWKELDADPQYSAGQSLEFYTFKTENGSRAALVVFDLNDHNFDLLPFFCENTSCPSKIAKQEKALMVINGGFFNLNNGESTSYVVINGKNQCEPKHNKALVENPALKPYLESIFNRSELQIVESKEGKRKAIIAAHNSALPKGWTLIHSLQAGPLLLPANNEAEEAFVRKMDNGKVVDSIGAYKPAARTAVGVTHDGHVLLLCVASKGQEEFSSGVTLAQLAQIMADLGCNRALNLDGGTSTTMVVAAGDYRDDTSYHLNKVISGNPEKMVKSGLMILKNAGRSESPYGLPR